MKVAFIQNDWRENHGILCLSAIVRKYGHTADIFVSGENNFENKFCEFKPDIIGFTVTTGTHKMVCLYGYKT